MKIRAVGFELFHTDGQTNVTDLTVDFRSFAEAGNKEIIFSKQNSWQHFSHYTVLSIRDQLDNNSISANNLLSNVHMLNLSHILLEFRIVAIFVVSFLTQYYILSV